MRLCAHILRLLAPACLFLSSCANIGSPEGGSRDYTPPRVLKTSPAAGATNYSGNKVEITFDEIVNLKDQMKKVSVSPTQKDPPLVRSLGKKVVVEFRDAMQPGTTYTIDFSNSIEDNNEGNPLDGYAFTFSTGDTLDSLRISGIVLRARDLEPMQHVLVGAYASCLDDTAFLRLPMERVTRTNSRGEFTLMGLKPGQYRVFALNDMDGDYHWARTEDYAFADACFEPTADTYTSQDTIFTFDHRVDTIVTGRHTAFLPNNVLLCMMNEDYQSLYLKRTERISPDRLHVLLSTACPEPPRVEVLTPRPTTEPWCVVQSTTRNDSLFYWLTDSTLIRTDTLRTTLTYLRTDSTDALSWQTDTITWLHRKNNDQLKQEAEARKAQERQEKRIAQLEQKQRQGKPLDDDEQAELAEALRPRPTPTIQLKPTKKGAIEVYDTLGFVTPVPLAGIDASGVRLEIKHDTVWVAVANVPSLRPVGDGMTWQLPMRLLPDSAYRLTVDSLAVTSIHGLHNDTLRVEVRVKALEEYANLLLRLNVNDSAFVELLNGSDAVQRTASVNAGLAKFDHVPPGTYYARVVLDRNGNGRWDTGNYRQGAQPEEVYYYPKPLRLRRNWDVEQQWNIYETALDLQKPDAVKKNKPEQNKSLLEKNRKQQSNDNDEEDEDDEFNSRGFGNNAYSGNKYRDYQNNRRSQ